MRINNILNTIKDLYSKYRITLFGTAILVPVFMLVPMGNAKNATFDSRVVLNADNINPLSLETAKTQIQPGIAKDDIDRLNQTADPELVKKLMQEIAPEYGIDWKLVYAIGYHESGNYSSSLARRNNNFFGRKSTSSGYASWSTPEEGIRNQFEYLKTRYFDRGLSTPESINPVYAEDGSWKYAVRSVMNTL